MKVKFFDRWLYKKSAQRIAGVSSALTVAFLFIDVPKKAKIPSGLAFLCVLLMIYIITWLYANRVKKVRLKIEGSTVNIKTGDIFNQSGFKVVAFNEFFDTQVDDKIIARTSLNGVFIESHLGCPVSALDAHIASYHFDGEDILDTNVSRPAGKKTRFRLGTVCVYNEFLLTAFAKFDANNQASLTMPEYLEFLINFWDRVNRVYAQKDVSTTVFGSGITRIKGHKSISDEDLLKIMLWTFRISEMRFKYPANLTIVIHPDKIKQINLFDIASVRNGV